MKRKEFLKKSLAGGTVLGSYPFMVSKKRSIRINDSTSYDFKLNYAPKLGTFREHAGEDLVDQLKFISDTGLKGLTDDGMRKKPVSEQRLIGEALARLILKIEVLGAHAYSWDKEHLVTGDENTVDSFLEEIKSKNTIVGYECDGSELEWKEGLPYPTFQDGTPTTFSVLCTAPSSWNPAIASDTRNERMVTSVLHV